MAREVAIDPRMNGGVGMVRRAFEFADERPLYNVDGLVCAHLAA